MHTDCNCYLHATSIISGSQYGSEKLFSYVILTLNVFLFCCCLSKKLKCQRNFFCKKERKNYKKKLLLEVTASGRSRLNLN